MFLIIRYFLISLLYLFLFQSIYSQDFKNTKDMEGFSFSKLYFTDHFTYVHVRGEVINQSGKNYTDVYFTIKLYDDKNDLLGISLIMLNHIANNKKKAFDSTTTDYLDIKMIKRYEIVFESGE